MELISQPGAGLLQGGGGCIRTCLTRGSSIILLAQPGLDYWHPFSLWSEKLELFSAGSYEKFVDKPSSPT